MRKQKDIFYGILFHLLIMAIVGLATNILNAIAESFNVSQFIVFPTQILLYVICLWVLNYKTDTLSPISWKTCTTVLVVILLNNVVFNYLSDPFPQFEDTYEATLYYSKASLYNLFMMCLIFLAYKKYRPERKGGKNYIWYGVLLASCIYITLDIIKVLGNIVLDYFSLQYTGATLIGLFFITLSLYIFCKALPKRPHVSGWFLIGLIVSLMAVNSLFGLYLSFAAHGYMNVETSRHTLTLFSYLISSIIYAIYSIAAVSYYRLNKGYEATLSDSPKNIKIIVLSSIGGICFYAIIAIMYIFTSSDGQYQRAKNEFYDGATKHFPLVNIHGQFSYHQSYENSQKTIMVKKAGQNSIREAHKELSSQRAVIEFKATDPRLDFISDQNNIRTNSSKIKLGEDYFPIPSIRGSEIFYNISSEEQKDTKSASLSEKLKVYVIEIKSQSTESETMWKHGYSRGIYISEEKEIVIYWALDW